jgi:hypothetical protein
MTSGITNYIACDFDRWRVPASSMDDPGALAQWAEHMATAHPEYWAMRNAVVARLANTGTYDTGHGEGPTDACGRLAQLALDALGLTP